MRLADEIYLIELFRERAAEKRREDRTIKEMYHAEDERREEQRREEKEDTEFAEVMAATKQQIVAFHERLDQYDAAIVDALIDNEHALEEAGKYRDKLEANAFELPDGRKVFKTEDGQRVFNANGAQVSRETIDPAAIPDSKTRWEDMQGSKAKLEELLREREKLQEFHKRVDAAREAGGKEGVTGKELDGLDADLRRDMPEAVRRKIEGEDRRPDPAAVAPSFDQGAQARVAPQPPAR